MRIAVVGVGLIGGSIALAARERCGASVDAYDSSPRALTVALERGAVQRACDSAAAAVAAAEAAFVAVPVGALPEVLPEVLAAAPAGCVVSDVGSVKRAVLALAGDERFIGGHPLAGAETSGIEHARADLFEGATWYLTPTERTSGALYERLQRLLCDFGALPAMIDADTHDRLLAVISHLPHVLANVLVAQAVSALGEGEPLPATGPSFRDATRVAGSSTAVWRDIYLQNRDALIEQIEQAIARLRAVGELLQAGEVEAIAAWNEAAAAHRRALLDAQRGRG